MAPLSANWETFREHPGENALADLVNQKLITGLSAGDDGAVRVEFEVKKLGTAVRERLLPRDTTDEKIEPDLPRAEACRTVVEGLTGRRGRPLDFDVENGNAVLPQHADHEILAIDPSESDNQVVDQSEENPGIVAGTSN